MSSLARSEHRYRNFVQMSREAVWRLEIDPPMPVSLPRPEQLKWLREHACVAESSLAHGWLDPLDAGGSSGKWWTLAPWAAQFERILSEAPMGTHDIDELLFTVAHRGRQHTYVASMQAVVEAGQILRFWGVARDVTELSELNTRLLANQDRLQAYARRVSEAEERARRETAVDLHDGIGQTLVGMQMMVDVARQRRPAELEPLLRDLSLRLHQVQDHTRRMITDLSPPGLYELGLAAALEWLVLQLREHDGLNVRLTCSVREAAIPVETRVLVFRLARELLRNAVRHSGVLEATLEAHGDEHLLRLKVSDAGHGFDGGLHAVADGGKGFGLWSIAERVREAGGRFTIDSAPEKGARFELEIPLHSQG
jgi:signal transduction histidine kinase